MLKKVTLLLVSDPVSTYRESGVKPASTVSPVSLMFEVNLCIYIGELVCLAYLFPLEGVDESDSVFC
jgi:hypothetical protein